MHSCRLYLIHESGGRLKVVRGWREEDEGNILQFGGLSHLLTESACGQRCLVFFSSCFLPFSPVSSTHHYAPTGTFFLLLHTNFSLNFFCFCFQPSLLSSRSFSNSSLHCPACSHEMVSEWQATVLKHMLSKKMGFEYAHNLFMPSALGFSNEFLGMKAIEKM